MMMQGVFEAGGGHDRQDTAATLMMMQGVFEAGWGRDRQDTAATLMMMQGMFEGGGVVTVKILPPR